MSPILVKYWKPLACLVALVAAFACGRFLVPTHVVTKTVDRVVTQTVTLQGAERVVYRDRVVTKDRTVIKYKDGTVVQKDVETTGDSQGQKDTTVAVSDKSVASAKEMSKVSDSPKAQWHISALAGVDVAHISTPSVLLGVHAERRIAGPFWGGVFALGSTSGATVGLSLGIEF